MAKDNGKRNAGLAAKQRAVDLINQGAYDNYITSSNVPTWQQRGEMRPAEPMLSTFQMGFDNELPNFNQVAEQYAMAQNPLYTSAQGVRGDFSSRNNALAELDGLLRTRMESLGIDPNTSYTYDATNTNALKPEQALANRRARIGSATNSVNPDDMRQMLLEKLSRRR
jgi:hypothetical protein